MAAEFYTTKNNYELTQLIEKDIKLAKTVNTLAKNLFNKGDLIEDQNDKKTYWRASSMFWNLENDTNNLNQMDLPDNLKIMVEEINDYIRGAYDYLEDIELVN